MSQSAVKNIFVIGSLNMDLVIEAPYIPSEGETLCGSNFMTNCGGKGANQSAACGKLGGKVYHCGAVGDDAFGNELIENLNKYGVNTDFIKREIAMTSGIAVIIVSEGNNRIILDNGANALLKKEDVDRALELARSGDVYLTQLENPIDVIGYGMQRAKEKGMFVILNPAPANKDILPYVKYADLITPNETELAIFRGRSALFKAGVQTIITTLGSRGFEIAKNDGTIALYPCPEVSAVDTTAAGDTLCGGLAVGISMGKSIEESAIFGSTAASIACTRRGAQQSIPTLDEVNAFIEQQRKKVK